MDDAKVPKNQLSENRTDSPGLFPAKPLSPQGNPPPKKVSKPISKLPFPKPDFRIDQNFLEFPIAYFGKTTTQHYVTYYNSKKNVLSKVGSMEGSLTGLGYEVFNAICYFTEEKNGKFTSTFSRHKLAEFLGHKPGGKFFQLMTKELVKCGALNITFNKYFASETKSRKAIRGRPVFEDFSLQFRDKEEHHGDGYFIWSNWLSPAIRGYFMFIKVIPYKSLPSPICKRLYCYLQKHLRTIGNHTENWELLASKIPITTKNITRRKAILVSVCDSLVQCLGYKYSFSGENIIFSAPLKKTKEEYEKEAFSVVQKKLEGKIIKQTDNVRINRLFSFLVKLGVNPAGEIGDILRSDPSRAERQIEYLSHREGVINKPAYLVEAIKKNYPPPPGYLKGD